jgi:hypothetical protein
MTKPTFNLFVKVAIREKRQKIEEIERESKLTKETLSARLDAEHQKISETR